MGAAAAAVPAAISLGGAAYSADQQTKAGAVQSSYYGYLADTARINAGIADAEATSDKKQVGAELNASERELTNRINETVATQKAAVVTGVGASSRSAQDIIADTLDKGNLDEMALRLNADIKSKNIDIGAATKKMNYTAQASGYGMAAVNAVGAAKAGAQSSLISGVGSVANSWYQSKLYADRTAAEKPAPVGKDK